MTKISIYKISNPHMEDVYIVADSIHGAIKGFNVAKPNWVFKTVEVIQSSCYDAREIDNA